MAKCLVTKLKEATNNMSLLKIGEMRVHVSPLNGIDYSSSNLEINVESGKTLNLEIIGNGYFTDSTLSSNLGKSLVLSSGRKVYLSDGEYEVSIISKYDITSFIDGGRNFTVDIRDLRFCPTISFISLLENSYGDISNLKNIKSPYISILSNNVKGDISAFSENNILNTLRIVSKNIFGDISAFRNKTALIYLSLINSNCNGDLATIAPNLKTFYSNDNSIFSWSNRSSDKTLFSIFNYPLINNLDKMLIDISTCMDGNFSTKVIEVRGNRTSSSDDAITILQNKGYTVSIH